MDCRDKNIIHKKISKASENQATALSQLLQAADQIASVVEENTAMAEESEASSEELAAQAAKLLLMRKMTSLLIVMIRSY